MVAAVGNTVGHVRKTNYGSIFDVIDLGAKATNLANTNVRIPAHTDNPYRDPVPGVQLLHCLSASTCGQGATTFLDGFAVAEALRTHAPEAFERLSRTPRAFRYSETTPGASGSGDVAADLYASRCPIDVHPQTGRVLSVAYNNRSAEPPSVRDDDGAEVEADYAAWRYFGALAHEPARQASRVLAPGECLVMMNGRVLHGREPFHGGGRWLQGCYVDVDEVRSRLRVLLNSGY